MSYQQASRVLCSRGHSKANTLTARWRCRAAPVSKLLDGFPVEAGIEIIAFGIEPTLTADRIGRSDGDDGLGLVDLALDQVREIVADERLVSISSVAARLQISRKRRGGSGSCFE